MKLQPRHASFRLSLGQRGEMIAWDFLIRQGYVLIEKNYRCPLGEIDIVARKNGRMVFIEVKTRSDHHFGRPEESVHAAKRRKLVHLAYYYLKSRNLPDAAVSFAVVAVTRRAGSLPDIRLIENAFEAEGA